MGLRERLRSRWAGWIGRALLSAGACRAGGAELGGGAGRVEGIGGSFRFGAGAGDCGTVIVPSLRKLRTRLRVLRRWEWASAKRPLFALSIAFFN